MHFGVIRELVMSTADTSFAVDDSGRVAAWNTAAEAMFALPARQAIGTQCNEIIRGTDENGPVCSADCRTRRSIRNCDPVGSFDLRVQTGSGSQWCNVSVLTGTGPGASGSYAIHIVRQIDYRKRLEMLAQNFLRTGAVLTADRDNGQADSRREAARNADLSPRETRILKLMAEGATTIAVGEQLHISRNTVNNHIQHILRKLGAHTRMEAVRRAQRSGLI